MNNISVINRNNNISVEVYKRLTSASTTIPFIIPSLIGSGAAGEMSIVSIQNRSKNISIQVI